MSKTMELAKTYDPKKVSWPVRGQVKYDGVPICYRNIGGHIVAQTRQSEPVHSVPHIIEELRKTMKPGDWIIAEHLVMGVNEFKKASGIIRRTKPDLDTYKIYGLVFDCVHGGNFQQRYADRMDALELTALCGLSAVGSILLSSPEDVDQMYDQVSEYWKSTGRVLEGIMLHDLNKDFKPGRRGWGMQRYKPQPTIDLEVVGYEEAVSKTGKPLGMVGRVNVILRRQGRPPAVVGVGPGKLTHDEREALWRAYMTGPEHLAGIGSIAEIKYMPDDSYDALRQPTFQRFRPDKEVGDVLD